MHELGIVFHVIKTVERVGAENDLTRAASVTLELGEVCGAIPRELISCWDWAVQKSDLLPHCGPRAGLPPLRQRGYLAAAGQRDQH